MGLTFKEIAIRLQIGVGTAHRLYARYVETGDVAPKTQPARPDCKKLDNLHELYVIALIHAYTFMKFVPKYLKQLE